MKKSFWSKRYAEGKIGFHQIEANDHLLEFLKVFVENQFDSVILPLCGKTKDLLYLASVGFKTIGVEFVKTAIQAFFAENKLTYRAQHYQGSKKFFADNIEIYCANFLKVILPVGQYNFFDRAALIALDSASRVEYARKLSYLAAQGSRQLLVAIEYDQSQMEGPPFNVTTAEIELLYQETWKIQFLKEANILDERFESRGLNRLVERVYLLEYK